MSSMPSSAATIPPRVVLRPVIHHEKVAVGGGVAQLLDDVRDGLRLVVGRYDNKDTGFHARPFPNRMNQTTPRNMPMARATSRRAATPANSIIRGSPVRRAMAQGHGTWIDT